MRARADHPRRPGPGARSGLALGLALALVASVLAAGAAAAPRAIVTPTISLQADPWVILPNRLRATATIDGPESMTGIFTLDLYFEDPTCSNSAPRHTYEVEIVGGTATVTGTALRESIVGGYYWRASFPGTSSVAPAASRCVRQQLLPAGTQPSFPFATWGEWVDRIHRSLLGRAPDAAELAEWTAALASGSQRPGDLVASIRRGPDHTANVDPVVRLYRAYFLRNPEAAGLTYWIGARRGGRGLDSVSQFFASSSEFTNRYGALDDAGFVGLVYRNVLGRAADGPGLAYWTAELTSHRRTRGQVMLGFSESPENRRVTGPTVDVTVLWLLLFGRLPSSATLANDVTRFEEQTVTLPDYADELVHRDDYTGHVTL